MRTSNEVEVKVDPRDFPMVERYYAGSGFKLKLTPAPGVRWVLNEPFADADEGRYDRYSEL